MAEPRPRPPRRAPHTIAVPPARFLMIEPADGNGPNFEEAMGALYTLAYQVKFAAAKRLGTGYNVAPAELLHPEAADATFPFPPKECCGWRLQLELPADIDGEFVAEVRTMTQRKRELPAVEHIRVQTFSEGDCIEVQTGRGDSRAAALHQLALFASQRRLTIRGPLHEIFLSDPFRTAPERLKTILRFPVRASR